MTEGETHMAPGDDTGTGPGREYPGIPGWVKMSGIIAIGLVLLAVVVLVVTTALGLHAPPAGPGGHGPGRRTSDDARNHTMLFIVREDDSASGGDLPGQWRSSVTLHGVQQT